MDGTQHGGPPQNETDWDEVDRRGHGLYERVLRRQLEPDHRDEFLAIDVDSGDYFLGATIDEALGAAREQRPHGKFYIARVGHDAALRLLQCR